jgi:tetratricopeptide (TPR) repeat protein
MSYETSQEIRHALEQNSDEPHGPLRCATAEDLAAAAEQLGDDALLVSALCELMTAYEYSSEPAKLPVTLARLLKLFDANRRAFGDHETRSLHWYFKWVTTALLALPDIPIQTIHDWVDQMSERYAEAGLKRQAVHAMRYHVAEHTGIDLDLAYEAWSTRPRDEMSDCEACEARSRGGYYVLRGDDIRALREWQPVLDQVLTCAEEPAYSGAAALASLVRVGRQAEAASVHRSGYRLVRGNVNLAVATAWHIEFCARTGNAARGVELLAESRGYFTAGGTYTDLEFLGGVQVLLARLVTDGHADIPVAGPTGTTWTARSLLESVDRDASALAARFDARNATSWVGDRHRTRCAAQPLTSQPLSLGLRGARTVPLPTPVAPVAPAATADDTGAEAFADLLAQARKLAELGRPDADRLWKSISAQVADADSRDPDAPAVDGVPVDDLLRAELASHRGFDLARSGEWAQARAEFERAQAAFTTAQKTGRAIAAEARSYWCALPPGRELDTAEAQAVWASLDEAEGRARKLLATGQIEAEQYLVVIQSRVIALLQRGDEADGAPGLDPHEKLNAACGLLRSEALRVGVPHRAAAALMMRGNLASGHGDFEGAESAVREAVEHLKASDRPWLLPTAYCFLAQLLLRPGHADEAMTKVHEALTLAAAWPDQDFNHAAAMMLLGEACSRSGDHDAAAEHLTSAASWFDRQADPRNAAAARAALGHTLLTAGRAGDAVAVLESVRDEGDDLLSPQQRAQARLDLGRGLRQLGEFRPAAEEFIWVANVAAGWHEQLTVQVIAVAEMATALAGAELWDQADAAVERALSLHRTAQHPAAICQMLRGVANLSMRLRGAEAVGSTLGYLSQADEINVGAAEVPGEYVRWPETAQTAELRTRVLADAGQSDEALAAADISIRAYQAGGDQTLAQQAEVTRIAAIVEGLRIDRRGPAINRLNAMINRCQAATLTNETGQLIRLRDRIAG